MSRRDPIIRLESSSAPQSKSLMVLLALMAAGAAFHFLSLKRPARRSLAQPTTAYGSKPYRMGKKHTDEE